MTKIHAKLTSMQRFHDTATFVWQFVSFPWKNEKWAKELVEERRRELEEEEERWRSSLSAYRIIWYSRKCADVQGDLNILILHILGDIVSLRAAYRIALDSFVY